MTSMVSKSKDYANQLYTRKYLRDASVTGRLGDMHINKDGSKTMGSRDQKIVYRWNYEYKKSIWATERSANTPDVLDNLKLGLDDATTPDSLTHKDLGQSICFSGLRLRGPQRCLHGK
jgi:hypothetical protein